MKIINIKIKQYRKSCGFKQENFAKKLNISVGSVKMYENGTRTPSQKIKIDICKLCNINLNELEGVNDRIELKNDIMSKLHNMDYTEKEMSNLKSCSLDFLYNIRTERDLAFSLKEENIKSKSDYYIIVIKAILYYIKQKYIPYVESRILKEKERTEKENSIYDIYYINFIRDNLSFFENTINELQPTTTIVKYLIPLVSNLSKNWNINVSNTDEFIELPYSLKEKSKKFIALRIIGETMIPKYEKGDIAIIEWGNEFKDKDDVVVSINGNTKIRRICKNKTGIILQPLNPNYDIEFYSNYEIKILNIIILGKIIGLNLNY